MAQGLERSALTLDPNKERLFFDDTGYGIFIKPRDLSDRCVDHMPGDMIDTVAFAKNLEVIANSKLQLAVKFEEYAFPVNPEDLRTKALILLYEQALVYARNSNARGVKMISPAVPSSLRVYHLDGINYHAIATFALLREKQQLDDI